MMLKWNKIMLMPPSIGFLNRGKRKYIKIYKGMVMKYENSNSHLNWPVMSGHTSAVKLPSKSAFCLGTLPSILLGVRNR